jgi:hypothetical protein
LKNLAIQFDGNRSVERFHAHHYAPRARIAQNDAANASQRAAFNEHVLSDPEKRQVCERLAGSYQCPDRGDFRVLHWNIGFAESNNGVDAG